MSSDLPLLIILVVIALTFISALLYISLRARHVATGNVVRVLVELWVAFALIIAIFDYISHVLGPAPSGSLADELLSRLAHWHVLLRTQQVTIVAGVLVALGLFVHVLTTIRALQSRPLTVQPTHEGENS